MFSDNNEVRKNRDHLWVTISLVILLSAFRFISTLAPEVSAFFQVYTEFPIVEVISNMLFFWLVGLLWIAYHRWKNTVAYNHKLENIISSISPDSITVVNSNRTITMCSGQIETMFGIKPKKLIGQSTDALYFDRRVRGEKGEIANNLEKYGFHIGQATGKRKNGQTFPLEIITGAISGNNGAVVLMRDITERKNTETALRESEARFELFMRYLPGCAFIKDSNLKYIYLNSYCEKAFDCNISDALGKTDSELLPPKQSNPITKNDRKIIAEHCETNYVTETDIGGKKYSMMTYAFPIIPQQEKECTMIGGISLDITDQKNAETERRNIEKQMLQSQKLESLGVLGGGIAHDFNNLLVGMLGHADLALTKLPENAASRENLEEVIVSAQRAADLANQLLAYSGEGKFIVETTNISDIVEEMSSLLNVSISKKAILDFKLNQTIPSIKCDQTQIRQVIMNLIVNASDSLDGNSGDILIETGATQLTSDNFNNTYFPSKLPHGEYVYVKISDTGIGMDEKICQSVFDPFFTTKFAGRGLGLAAVMGIIRSHKGTITLDSTLGKGTIFTIYLPSTKEIAIKKTTNKLDNESWQGSGVVLVADDEESVRNVAKMMLESIGFDVIIAQNGREALEIFKENSAKFCSILLDLTMPELGGIETYHEIRKIDNSIPIILSSGYNKQDEITQINDEALPAFLKKPYRLHSMRKIFKTALN